MNDVSCCCDGNGSIECTACGGLGFVSVCVDDLCRSSSTCRHTRGCRECNGSGVQVCGAPEHELGPDEQELF